MSISVWRESLELIFLVLLYGFWLLWPRASYAANFDFKLLVSLVERLKKKIFIGRKVERGEDLLAQVQKAYLYQRGGVLRKKTSYKHFSEAWEKIIYLLKETGDFNEQNIKLFEKIISEDVQFEKKLRNLIATEVIQMTLVGVIILFVLGFLIVSFPFTDQSYHLEIQFISELAGCIFFVLMLRKWRKDLISPLFLLLKPVQYVTIFHQSGLGVSKVIDLANIKEVYLIQFNDPEIEKIRLYFLDIILRWRDFGEDCHSELIKTNESLFNHFSTLARKVERRASVGRLFVLAIFFLSSYLINMLILLQTYIENSFYTAGT